MKKRNLFCGITAGIIATYCGFIVYNNQVNAAQQKLQNSKVIFSRNLNIEKNFTFSGDDLSLLSGETIGSGYNNNCFGNYSGDYNFIGSGNFNNCGQDFSGDFNIQSGDSQNIGLNYSGNNNYSGNSNNFGNNYSGNYNISINQKAQDLKTLSGKFIQLKK